MKKLKLKALEFGAEEILTRPQLKNILGGTGSGGGGGNSCQEERDTSNDECNSWLGNIFLGANASQSCDADCETELCCSGCTCS